MNQYLMSSYKPLQVAFESGQGAWLTDREGDRYLDALSGIAVCGLGHAHPLLQQALADQAGRLLHTSNLYRIPLQEKLAQRLVAIAGMNKVFFCNSGAEANEAAIKIARLYGHIKNTHEPVIIVAEGSFHGRTMATLSASGNAKVQAGFEPLLTGFRHVPYNDPDVIETILSHENGIVAVMLEPIQGEGGINIPDGGYLKSVRELCNAHDVLLILDEIQTGLCRTGKWFAFQHEGIIPDIMTVAKALGNGVPIGACMARGKAADLIQPGSHGSTFGGNPLAARAALTVLDVLEGEELAQQAAAIGQLMLTRFEKDLATVRGVVAVRGCGLMIGIELDRDCGELVARALRQRLLINVTAGRVIRLLPPLIITEKEALLIVDLVGRLIREFLQQE
ncbi:MAG TPA: aspartate aminotransferase family protein [Gammaproteobacteria bacterium]|nr:aspartate aminotransferase family protein [Gammaproteobacteria bacterium]